MEQTPAEAVAGLPAHILLDIARNPSQSREWRKAAVKLLVKNNYPQANHPELSSLVLDIKAERVAEDEVEAVVESAVESQISESPALRASVTTQTLFQTEVARNAETLNDDALVGE
jgi:hypothetical protein